MVPAIIVKMRYDNLQKKRRDKKLLIINEREKIIQDEEKNVSKMMQNQMYIDNFDSQS